MKAPEQVPLRELLRDPLFRKWMTKIPRPSPRVAHRGWSVWVRIGAAESSRSRWARKRFRTYAEAYRWLIPRLRQFSDAALCSEVQRFKPPLVKTGENQRELWLPRNPDLAEALNSHLWCPHCRRPTVFFTFRKHHALPPNMCASYEPRCTICGVRRSSIRDYRRERQD